MVTQMSTVLKAFTWATISSCTTEKVTQCREATVHCINQLGHELYPVFQESNFNNYHCFLRHSLWHSKKCTVPGILIDSLGSLGYGGGGHGGVDRPHTQETITVTSLDSCGQCHALNGGFHGLSFHSTFQQNVVVCEHTFPFACTHVVFIC